MEERVQCDARYFGDELNVRCTLNAGHPNQHIGAPAEGGEGMMWRDSEPMTEELVDDGLWWLPPLGVEVVVIHKDGAISQGILRANVLGDEGARIMALLIDTRIDRAVPVSGDVRVLVSWDDVCGVRWAR